MTRQTFTATVEATVENAPEGYTSEDFADNIRDGTFQAITVDAPLEVVVMQVNAAPERGTVAVDVETDEGCPDIVWIRYGNVSLAVTESATDEQGRKGIVISVDNPPTSARPVNLVLSSSEKVLWEGKL